MISSAETEEDVSAAINGISEQINNLTETLNEKLDEAIEVGLSNDALADRIGEAKEYANWIREQVSIAFADSYGEAEIMATSKQTTIIFANRIVEYAAGFEDATDKDHVD